MKRLIYFASVALATLTLASCQKAENGPQVGTEKATVKISLTNASTRGTVDDTADEAKVSSIQAFVFNGDAVDGFKNATSTEVSDLAVELSATAGTRDIYAFVNAPDFSGYTSKSAVLAAVSKLSDNVADAFVMSGKLVGENVTVSYSGNVAVDRYASRIRLLKVTRNFSNVALQSVNFQITKLYLTSVVTNELYSFGVPDTYTWAHQSFGADGEAMETANAFLYKKPTAIPIANGSSDVTEHVFYAYPNTNTTSDTADPMTFKTTRLVVECQIDVNGNSIFDEDEYFTYPIEIAGMASNKSYEIKELVLTRLGNHSDGDDKIDKGEDDIIIPSTATVTIVVNDWGEVLVGTEGVVTI